MAAALSDEQGSLAAHPGRIYLVRRVDHLADADSRSAMRNFLLTSLVVLAVCACSGGGGGSGDGASAAQVPSSAPPPLENTALGNLASSMAPGTWAQLNVPTQDAVLGVGNVTGSMLPYCNSMPWNPFSKVIEIV